MNFKNFLANDTHLQESHFIGDVRPMVLGYGTLSPLHIGYVPMISEMLKLSEEHKADAVLTIFRTTESDESIVTAVSTLMADYSFLKIVVERDLTQSMIRMHSYQQSPIAMLGDPVIVKKALASCKVVFGESHQIQSLPGYLPGIQHICERAVEEDDFNTFYSHIVDTNTAQATKTFEYLKEAHGKQQSI